MVEKQPMAPAGKDSPKNPNNPKTGGDQRKPEDKTAEAAHDPVDRPGFDLGGSTGKTEAGTGLGLGPDAAESGEDRRLPRGGGKPT